MELRDIQEDYDMKVSMIARGLEHLENSNVVF